MGQQPTEYSVSDHKPDKPDHEAGGWTFERLEETRRQLTANWAEAGYYANITLSEALVAGCRTHPDTLSVYCSDGTEQEWSNRTLLDHGLRMAGALRRLGIGRGDIVAVQLPTWHEGTLLLQAVAHVGAIALPIITAYGAAETSFVLTQSGAKALFIPEQWRKGNFVARIPEFRKIPTLEHIIVVRGAVESATDSADSADSMAWDAFLALQDAPITPEKTSPDDVALLMYTSGTTSAPKGVRHTHNTLLREWGRPAYANRGLYLSNLPVGHYSGYGHILRPLIYGAPMLFLDRWDASYAARLIDRYKVREGGGTPLFLLTLLEAATRTGANIGSLQYFTLGGQGMTPALIEEAQQAGIQTARVYGSTEHPTVSICSWDDPPEMHATTDGRIDEGNEVRILDEEGRDLPPGHEGEIVTRGPEMLVGYLDHQVTLDSFLPGCWFITGDIGRVDARGYLTITDRKKDIIIRGGENIASVEVENLLLSFPGVVETAAVAMPDKIYGERVCAFLVMEKGAAATLDDIRAHFARSGVGHQKAPEHIEIVASLPRNSSGKVKKFELREQARAIAGRTS